MKIISLGWGIQSYTLAAMVALGELEPVDAALHADTAHESKLTYEFAERWTGWLEERGVKVVTVRDEKAPPQVWQGKMIPAYTTAPSMLGQALRSCTQRWKIAPMHRWMQANRNGERVEQWIGISLDEWRRMKPAKEKYIVTRWPLIEKNMTRLDCAEWLKSHNLEIPPRSACTFCPYHNTAEWRRIKNTPEDWAEAVAVDNAIRKARPPYDLFVHPSRKPLELVDLRTEQERGQLELWDMKNWDEECSGICGV